MKRLFLLIASVAAFSCTTLAMEPVVAIHDSELTRALEYMPATGATPVGSGATGYQWWVKQWHYFVMPESLKEALRSDGTAFVVVSDADIAGGALLDVNGQPKYPILISLSSEAIDDAEIAQLTNYVAAGGFLMAGGSAFTRYPDGNSRGDFAFSGSMGVHMTNASLQNWGTSWTFTKQVNQRLVSDIPGDLEGAVVRSHGSRPGRQLAVFAGEAIRTGSIHLRRGLATVDRPRGLCPFHVRLRNLPQGD
jgi:hypothetical protein